MLEVLRNDYARGSKNKRVLIVMIIYRVGNEIYYSNMNQILKRLLLFVMKILNFLLVEIPYNIEIPFSARIGQGLRLVHLNGIILHPNVVIGENCTLFHQVTIGANEHKSNYHKVAKIGDNV